MKVPVTPAVRALRAAGADFTPHFYKYVEGGGASAGAEQLELKDSEVVKTLIMETDQKQPLVVLMHGDRKVSTKALARHLGVKTVSPCDPKVAQKHSGYKVGGTSPFGLRKQMPIYVEESIAELPKIYVNGGKRGFLVGLDPELLWSLLGAERVSVAV